ncbi:MAG TPA: hypothetical protein VH370_04460 [Humisphaera sp.]|nr:hypothetical protein [Humisphaera sp.]
MSEIQENTEAKLAAYIDGELEGAERAEIEKLLEQNPNYRRVLDQLQITRDMLRALPRETAPADMCESFSGQLERSVLLEGLSEKRGPRLSINRWPQVAALAAIVLLTVGLAGLFYFVLPKGNPGIVADTRKPPAGPAEPKRETESAGDPGAADKTDDQRRSGAAGTLADAAGRTPGGGGGGFGGRRSGALGGFGGAAAAGLATEPASVNAPEALAIDVYRNEQLQNQLNTAAVNQRGSSNVNGDAASDQALVMVVQTSDPQEVRRDLTNYFANNSIKFESASPQVQLAANSAALSYRDRESQMRAAPTQQAREIPGGISQNAGPMLQRNADEQQQAARQLQQQQLDNSLPIENVYIARGIMRSQATDLQKTIGAANVASQNDGKNYAMTSNAANENQPAVANTGQVAIQAQNQQGQTPARGYRQEFSVLLNRSDYSSNDLAKTKSNGPDRGQALGQLEAATSQPHDLKDAISQASARGTAGPAQSQPSDAVRRYAQSNLTSQKALAPDAAKAAPATLPSDEPVDVVIIVQRAAPPPATQPAMTQPATQPADAPQIIR